MRRASGRALTAAALVAGLAVLVVAGRLLPVAPGARPPATTGTVSSQPAWAPVPDAVGQPLGHALAAMRAAGLRGVVADGDPQGTTAVVIAQEPAAGEPAGAGSVIGLRTSADLVPIGTPRRVRLTPDRGAAVYLIQAPDPARHALAVTVDMPPGAGVVVALEPGRGQEPLVVLFGAREPTRCPVREGRIRCVVRFGALEALAPGTWIVTVANRLPGQPEVTVTVTVGFRRL